MRQVVAFEVEGMDCAACERRLRAVLGRLDGAEAVEADHVTGRVRLRFDAARADPQMLIRPGGRTGRAGGVHRHRQPAITRGPGVSADPPGLGEVGQVAVSLTHEQALVDYDPAVVAPGDDRRHAARSRL